MTQYDTIVEELFEHKFKGGPCINYKARWNADTENIKKVEGILKKSFADSKVLYNKIFDDHYQIGEFQNALDQAVRAASVLAQLYGYEGETSFCDEMEIPMWQGTFNFVKLNMPRDFSKKITFEKFKNEIADILDLVNTSEEDINCATKKGHPNDLRDDDYEPKTIASITFDYFNDEPEYVISVASDKEEYSYHVSINKDRTFVSDSIG